MEKIHVFEQAGLGQAPFTFAGFYESRTKTGQPAGTCQYCGNGIAICCSIKSADGQTFVVGSDCVKKTGDEGLKNRVNRARAAAKKEAEWQKKVALLNEHKEWVSDNRDALSKIAHGKYTMLESIEWFFVNAGMSGKMRIIAEAKSALAEAAQ